MSKAKSFVKKILEEEMGFTGTRWTARKAARGYCGQRNFASVVHKRPTFPSAFLRARLYVSSGSHFFNLDFFRKVLLIYRGGYFQDPVVILGLNLVRFNSLRNI